MEKEPIRKQPINLRSPGNSCGVATQESQSTDKDKEDHNKTAETHQGRAAQQWRETQKEAKHMGIQRDKIFKIKQEVEIKQANNPKTYNRKVHGS